MLTHKKQFETIDEYIKTFPKNVQSILETIRQTIRKAAPEAEEAISYQILTFKLNGKYLVYFAAYKKHISMYPFSSAMSEGIPLGEKSMLVPSGKEASAYKTSGKGTIQFPIDKPLPLRLIKKIVKYRVKENLERERTKTKK